MILLAIPLYPKFPLFNIPGTYVAVRAEDFVLAALGLVWFTQVLLKPREFLKDKINLAILLFFAVGLLSVLGGLLLTQTIQIHIGLLHWARRVEYILAFFIASSVVKKQADVRFFAEVLMVSAFITFLYGLGQMHLEFPVISTQNEEFSKGLALKWVPGARLHSTFAGHYDLAAFSVMTLPLLVAFFFAVRSWIGKILVFSATASSFWLLLASSSRVSVPAYLVAAAIALWIIKKRKWIIPVVAVSLIFILTSGGLIARYGEIIKVYLRKFNVIQIKGAHLESFKIAENKFQFVPGVSAAEEVPSPTTSLKRLSTATPTPTPRPIFEDRSASIRLNVEWPRALRAFYKNPLLGSGYSSITLATDSDYLRLLGEIGLVGAASFLLVLARIWQILLSRVKKIGQSLTYADTFVAGFIGAFVAMLITATFIDIFEASKAAIIFWTLAGISVGAVRSGLVGKKGE